MKRILMVLLCCLALVTPVFAAGENVLQVTAQVSSGGSSEMEMQLTLQPEEVLYELTIPLGAGARDVTVNGAAASLQNVDGMPSLVLTSEAGFSSSLSLTLRYTLTGCVSAATDWELVLPILAEGLDYAIDTLRFQVTLPGSFTQTPVFSSGYLGEDVDNYMTITIQDNVISGSLNTPLRDRDSLTLTMETDPELFPRVNAAGKFYPIARLLALGLGLLGLLYWLVRLRWLPALPGRQSQPPVGIGPGELGCKLLTESPDLPLMILSWAQLGYLTIHMGQDGAVTLHKRMEMGNERSDYENQLFAAVFGHRQTVDAAERSFQELRAKVSVSAPRVRGMFRKKSGKVLAVRVLGALSGAFALAGIVDVIAPQTSGRVVLIILAGLLGAAAAWCIQAGMRSLLARDHRPGYGALGCCGILLVLGLFSGCFGTAFGLCLTQGLLGLLTMFGGRRTEVGRQTVQSILGFRRYLRSIDRKQVNRIMEQRPGFYYDMAPYALALGVDRQFAVQFETLRLPPCPWLVTDTPQGNRAPEWYPVLRQVIQGLQGKLPQTRSSWLHISGG